VRVQYGARYPLGEVAFTNMNDELAPYPTFSGAVGGTVGGTVGGSNALTKFVPHKQEVGVFYMRSGLARWPGVDAEGRCGSSGGRCNGIVGTRWFRRS